MSTSFLDILDGRDLGRFSHRNAAVLALLSPQLVSKTNKFQEMVRARLRERTPNYSTLARFLRLEPSTIQKRLREGGPALCLDFLDDVSAFYQLSVSEMCALPGSLVQEIKPLEAQLLTHFRQMTELQRHSLLSVLDRSTSQPATRRRARLGRAELTEEQQLLVDLYVRSNEQARAGILKTLRGTARVGDGERDPKRETSG